MADHAASPNIERVFLTGEPGCGKTTVVRKTAELLASRGLKVGGMMSNEVRERGTRVGFCIEDLLTHQRGMLSDVSPSEGPRVGKYRVNLGDLEGIGAAGIRKAIDSADLVVIDEVGPMELKSGLFVESVRAALNSKKSILGTIHRRASSDLILEVRSNPKVAILEVTLGNRETLPVLLADKIIGTG